MMLSNLQRDLRNQIEVVSYRFLHAEAYFRAVTGHDSTYWVFSQNCFGEVACLLWCHLFNSRSNDPVHYWKLFGNDQLAPLSAAFGFDVVKERLLRAAGFVDGQSYEVYRQKIIDFRNKYVSHREYELGSITFPDLTKASAMVLTLREVLAETVSAELAVSPDDGALQELATYYEMHPNQSVLSKCEREARMAIADTPNNRMGRPWDGSRV